VLDRTVTTLPGYHAISSVLLAGIVRGAFAL